MKWKFLLSALSANAKPQAIVDLFAQNGSNPAIIRLLAGAQMGIFCQVPNLIWCYIIGGGVKLDGWKLISGSPGVEGDLSYLYYRHRHHHHVFVVVLCLTPLRLRNGKVINSKRPEFKRMRVQQNQVLEIREICEQDAGNYTVVMTNTWKNESLEKRLTLNLIVNGN